MKKFHTSIFLIFISLQVYAQSIFVRQNAIGNNDGSSWEHAFLDLQDALSHAEYGDDIWVAAGIYLPTNDGNRTISFSMKSGVALYGGF